MKGGKVNGPKAKVRRDKRAVAHPTASSSRHAKRLKKAYSNGTKVGSQRGGRVFQSGLFKQICKRRTPKPERCFVCVHGSDDPALVLGCRYQWSQAKKNKGATRAFIVSIDDFPYGLEDLHTCNENLIIETVVHGSPGEHRDFVSTFETVVDQAPQCARGDSEIRIHNCSNFADEGGVLRTVRGVARRFAQRGYIGSLRVTGNQMITLGRLKPERGVITTLTVPVRAVLGWIADIRVKKQNSWLTYHVCAEGITPIFPPCKPQGTTVMVDMRHSDKEEITTTVCSHEGKRGNQRCELLDASCEGICFCKMQHPVVCGGY